jgi:hypothetical protein
MKRDMDLIRASMLKRERMSVPLTGLKVIDGQEPAVQVDGYTAQIAITCCCANVEHGHVGGPCGDPLHAGGVLSRFKFAYDDLVAIAPDPRFAGFD